ncbi:uncharacterized protein A1O9_03529 [Exophiala aquamarina CBS 119918]|uniref:Suppressor of anucleate metulae protein B n=1 Tax=Exophiala aquamarina CBS 119918 TaxID=1182545 RepID=A0A072PQD5_9EURO|nr:uncharacterized protein A1O9_03529 [Exophiala aquamarina CBS 119918]KEF61957.1 hypothetical protein A1O9_03529 [Exophiala aquamarina CBS 119918]
MALIAIEIPFEETCIMCPRRGSKRCPGCGDARYCSKARDTGRDDEETIIVHFKDDTSKDPPNIGVRIFTRAGVASKVFRRPILVTRKGYRRGSRGAIEEIRDFDMRDVRKAADYFCCAYRSTMPQSQLSDVHILATGIACPKDVSQRNLRTNWQERVIDDCDQVYQSEGSGIAHVLAIPLTLCRFNHHECVEQGDVVYTSATDHLMRDITSTTTGPQEGTRNMPRFRHNDRAYAGTQGFGSSPNHGGCMSRLLPLGAMLFPRAPGIPISTGSVVVARADGLPLIPVHLEAICSYISDKGEPRLTNCISGLNSGASIPQREQVSKLDHQGGLHGILQRPERL